MKKGIIVIILATFLIVILGVFLFIVVDYMNSPIGKIKNTGVRKTIEDGLSVEISYEVCELNDFRQAGFSSMEDCRRAVRCTSAYFASLIAEMDVDNVFENMKIRGGESGSIEYLDDNAGISIEFEKKSIACIKYAKKFYY